MKHLIYIVLFFQFGAKAQSCNYWSTFLGKIGSDDIKGIALDNNKNSYIIMQTDSPSLSIVPGLISDNINGINDAYIAKFDSCGNFIWGTYLGTTGFDSGEKIVVCPDGNIAFTGYTQGTGLPTTPACFQSTLSGQFDCFLGKITPNGNLLWLTYFGKNSSDFAYDLACDFNGNIFIGGTTTSTIFFTNASSFQQNFGGNTDSFIAKFSSSGNLKWCTYYGGLGVEDIHVLTTDVFGNVFGSGGTSSFNLSTSVGCIQPSLDALRDCYIIKLDSVGNRIFSSYLGGMGQDDAFGLATDAIGNLYMSGQTSSTNFTTTSAAYQTTISGMTDMFFTKISPTGNLLYSTYFGGTDDDVVNRMKIHNNELYLLGTTTSSNIPMLGVSNYSALPGAYSLIVVRFNSAGQPNYSTYFGGVGGYDFGQDVAITTNNLFFCGKTSTGTYPVTASAFQNLYAGNDDGILTRLQNNNASILTNELNFENNKVEYVLFPNPTQGKLAIKNYDLNETKISVINCLGQLIKELEFVNAEIDVKDLAEGVYFVKIKNATYKFIKVN
ncbi:MAG: SBBP repeat-containing protein [Bacteroidota bacterium]|nr:SBBP repeat-containing protein [Bacteroidota bacterium]MDP3146334.1 SBBP repeat-containing protein [Bacteroidota bacterium]MDP3556594.1 SBBP repeat-containing protein [Bacteroidota bacterium]